MPDHYNDTIRLAKLIGLYYHASDSKRVVWRQVKQPSAYSPMRKAWPEWRPFERDADLRPIREWLAEHHPYWLSVLEAAKNIGVELAPDVFCRDVFDAFGESKPVEPEPEQPALTPDECEIALAELAVRLEATEAGVRTERLLREGAWAQAARHRDECDVELKRLRGELDYTKVKWAEWRDTADRLQQGIREAVARLEASE